MCNNDISWVTTPNWWRERGDIPPTCTTILPRRMQFISTTVMSLICCLAMAVTLKAEPVRTDKEFNHSVISLMESKSLHFLQFPTGEPPLLSHWEDTYILHKRLQKVVNKMQQIIDCCYKRLQPFSHLTCLTYCPLGGTAVYPNQHQHSQELFFSPQGITAEHRHLPLKLTHQCFSNP